MFWLQALISFSCWLAYGVIQSRRSNAIRNKLTGMSRTSRILGAAGLFIGSLAFLVVALFTLYSLKGFEAGGMKAWAWILITTLGLAFVHSQTLAMAMLVTVAQESVTTTRSETSTSKDSN